MNMNPRPNAEKYTSTPNRPRPDDRNRARIHSGARMKARLSTSIWARLNARMMNPSGTRVMPYPPVLPASPPLPLARENTDFHR